MCSLNIHLRYHLTEYIYKELSFLYSMQICNTQLHNRVVSGHTGDGMDLERNHFLMIWLSHHNIIHETEEHIALTEASTGCFPSWLCYVSYFERKIICLSICLSSSSSSIKSKWWQSFIDTNHTSQYFCLRKKVRKYSINFKVGKYNHPLLSYLFFKPSSSW